MPAFNCAPLAEAETPMLRLLGFPPGVYIPLLLGIGCLILCTIDVTCYILARAHSRCCDLLKRTANTSPKRKRG